jgi:hypothetical protein
MFPDRFASLAIVGVVYAFEQHACHPAGLQCNQSRALYDRHLKARVPSITVAFYLNF